MCSMFPYDSHFVTNYCPFYISFVSLLQRNTDKYKRLLIAGMVMSMAFLMPKTG